MGNGLQSLRFSFVLDLRRKTGGERLAFECCLILHLTSGITQCVPQALSSQTSLTEKKIVKCGKKRI